CARSPLLLRGGPYFDYW
nr:immunoglobulin heavy chain junction region [Mus musculus]NSM03788.1 immunoglobulin heavy chain junction region [Mus musculus]NSM04308.1 immunoglobulin heavy chain junction region [Mus musculus]NSM04353.1 immunoglobulin heavy chain junction region [Mus musculus]NSM04437.1 immunoglobulin heavy chain junction region [Mus musculus]